MDFNEYEYLCHHGIQGMKWGVRRYQNKDGTRIKSGTTKRASKDSKEYHDYESKCDQAFKEYMSDVRRIHGDRKIKDKTEALKQAGAIWRRKEAEALAEIVDRKSFDKFMAVTEKWRKAWDELDESGPDNFYEKMEVFVKTDKTRDRLFEEYKDDAGHELFGMNPEQLKIIDKKIPK